jgi:YHS domain-containing protein
VTTFYRIWDRPIGGRYNYIKRQSSRCGGEKVEVVDPVCRMVLNEEEARFKAEYQGKTYFFCNLADKKKFEADPEKYLES